MGLIFFHFSYAAQYSSLRRIWSSSIRPTSLDTEVFSSAAFLRAQRAASSLTVIVILFNTNSVYRGRPRYLAATKRRKYSSYSWVF